MSAQCPVRLRSALFVDFDNVYLGLQQEDKDAAECFAGAPATWIEWMERGMAIPDVGDDVAVRRTLLLRRCYLSPRAFGRRRPCFTRAGFEVMDCPALTGRGKNSADIRMAIDILDALRHPTHFDEFILLSSDSDFTPVLLRLRTYDRRTTVLSVGNLSGAYRSACDLTIEAEEFIEHGLGSPRERSSVDAFSRAVTRLPFDPSVLEEIAEKVYEQASIGGRLDPHDLPPIYRQFEDFRKDTDWLGFHSLRAMTEALVGLRTELVIGPGDPWSVAVTEPDDGGAETSRAELAQRVRECVATLVKAADEPVTLASAAQIALQEIGDVVSQTRWAGAGSFKNLLQGIDLEHIAFSTVAPGYIYDTTRHTPPRSVAAPDQLAQTCPELAALSRMVHQITDVPKLAPAQFGLMFRLIAEETDANDYSLTQTSKDVRDRCNEAGSAVSRGAVAFVLKGLNYAGYEFSIGPDANPPRVLAERFRDNVIDLCDTAGFEITQEQLALLDRWLVDGVEIEAEETSDADGGGG